MLRAREAERRDLEKAARRAAHADAVDVAALAGSVQQVGDVPFVRASIGARRPQGAAGRGRQDQREARRRPGVIVLASGSNAVVLRRRGASAYERGVDANAIREAFSREFGGGGNGRPDARARGRR